MSGTYNINYRSHTREATSARALAVLSNAREAIIRLCDTSEYGVGFLVAKDSASLLRKGQEIRIKFRGGSGSVAQRKILIRSVVGNRIGAQYA
ncbi:MAG: hypothetical protein D6B25_17625 [Desulfobulbaceae bacterium]|nr:MAG: hypothetical protein D6B25_17625 [Desulfobulbaceae bacterium]